MLFPDSVATLSSIDGDISPEPLLSDAGAIGMTIFFLEEHLLVLGFALDRLERLLATAERGVVTMKFTSASDPSCAEARLESTVHHHQYDAFREKVGNHTFTYDK